MATVRMLITVSGTRNGREWPRAGGTIDLPDHEAADLVRARLAELVAVPVETAEAPPAPERAVARRRR